MIFLEGEFKKLQIFIIFFTLFLYSSSAFSQLRHITSFEDRATCEETSGIWRQFGVSCGDRCISKFDRFAICAWKITYACDCGKGKCWDGRSCVAMKKYEKFYNKQEEKERKIVEEARQKRKIQALIQNKERMLDLIQDARPGTVPLDNAENPNPNLSPSNNFSQVYKEIAPDYDPNKERQEFHKKLEGRKVEIAPDGQPLPEVKPIPVAPAIVPPKPESGDSGPTPFFMKILEEQAAKKLAEEAKKITKESGSGDDKSEEEGSDKIGIPIPAIPGLPVIEMPK